MRGWITRLLVFVWVCCAAPTLGHEIRPAYLQINEVASRTYDVLWKVPSNGDLVLDIQPQFDDGLQLQSAGGETILDGFVVYRYRLTGDKGLAGTRLSIRGLSETAVDVLANLTLLDGGRQTFLLGPQSASATIPEKPSPLNVVATYTKLGVEHILFGIDHLLFVASLMLIVRRWQMLVKTITAFTVAHSVTLGLATFGLVTLPGPPVETMIALSIVLVCAEAVRLRRGETSLAIQWPWIVAFAFGLLHGFGFAGALMEIGLPHGDIPLALLFFNVGVELGQLAFIAAILVLTALVRRLVDVPRPVPIAAAYAIGAVASFWMLGRLSTMFT